MIKFYPDLAPRKAEPPLEPALLTKTVYRPRWLTEHNAKKRVVIADGSDFGWDWAND